MLTLLLDETGRVIGRGDATGVPGYVLGANEVEATQEQFANPTAWMLQDGHLVAAPELPAAPAPVPSISRAQAKIQLRRAGLRDRVEAIVAEAGADAQDWYAEAGTWSRDHTYVVQIAAALDLTPEQTDDHFRAAALINV